MSNTMGVLPGLSGMRAVERDGQPGSDSPIRVMIIHTLPLLRAGLAAWLNHGAASPRTRVVAVESSCTRALFIARDHRPEVVLIDGSAEGALEAARALHQLPSRPGVIVIAGAGGYPSVQASLAANVSGYVPLHTTPEDLLSGIATVVSGGIYVHRDAAARLARFVDGSRAVVQNGVLSSREVLILRRLSQGMSLQNVAQEFGVTERTLRRYFASISVKLGARTHVQAVAEAIRRGVLD